MKALEEMRQLGLGDAGAGITHPELGVLAVGARRDLDRDLAVEGELERIRQEVEDDLLPHVAIDMDRLAERRGVDAQSKAGPVDGGAERRGELGSEGGEIDRLVARLRLARFQAREVEQRIHHLQEPHAVAMRRRYQAAIGRYDVALGL